MRIRLSDNGDVLVTRERGERLRTVLREKVDSLPPGEILEIDFEGVENMTPSFADECFGKFIEALGREEFAKRVKLLKAAPLVRGVVKMVMGNRLARRFAPRAGDQQR